MIRRLPAWWGFAFFAAGLAVYAAGASRAPVMDSKTDDMLRVLARGANIDTAAEEALARAYWERYPDVRANPLYGEKGSLGVLGAREHFMQHGRREGRVWGP
jgi:hypothetical protein